MFGLHNLPPGDGPPRDPRARLHLRLLPDRPLRRNAARCEGCGDVIESTDENLVCTCGCGALTVSGGLGDTLRSFVARPGAAWTELSERDGDPEVIELSEGPSEAAPRPVGFDAAGSRPRSSPPGPTR